MPNFCSKHSMFRVRLATPCKSISTVQMIPARTCWKILWPTTVVLSEIMLMSRRHLPRRHIPRRFRHHHLRHHHYHPLRSGSQRFHHLNSRSHSRPLPRRAKVARVARLPSAVMASITAQRFMVTTAKPHPLVSPSWRKKQICTFYAVTLLYPKKMALIQKIR